MAFFGPTPADICISRGDSPVIPVTVEDDAGVAVNITGGVFTLTVDPGKDPVDASDNLFNVAGVIVVPADGTVTFTPTTSNTDIPAGIYFYDIQMVLNGSTRTILKGEFEILQDITKT